MERTPIQRLRIKFVVINMALATIVLVFTFGTICVLNHNASVNAIYDQLTSVLVRVASAEGTAPNQVDEVQRLERPEVDRADITLTDALDAAAEEDPKPVIGVLDSGKQHLSNPTNAVNMVDARNATDALSGADASSEDEESGLDAETTANTPDVPSQASESDAALPEDAHPNTEDGDASASESASSESTVAPPVIGGANGSATVLTAVFKVEENGIYTAIPAYTTAMLPERILLRADEDVIASSNARGYLPEYDLMYERLSTDGGWYVAYADASRTHEWQRLAFMLAMVGAIALVIFFLINIFFSNWAVRPVMQSIKRQQQFTADASHELKTPLTVILANLSILRSHPDSSIAEQMQWIESSETEAHRMQLLVNDMLSLARPQHDKEKEAARTAANAKRLDLSDLVEGEVLQFESVAFDRGILLESRIQEGVSVDGDEEKLGRMVSTLIDNACKYVEPNGLVDVSLTIEAPAALTDPVALLSVHNTGEPIAPEDLEHLFDRFYRADKARTGGKGGYGLGLAIGQQIAHEHNGEITVSSSLAEGTTFTVTLPLSDE